MVSPLPSSKNLLIPNVGKWCPRRKKSSISEEKRRIWPRLSQVGKAAIWCPRGLEPPEEKTEEAEDEDRCKSENSAPSSIASRNPGKISPELAQVVATWPKLGPEVRVAILTLIRAAALANSSDRRERQPRDEASTGIRCEAGPSEGGPAPETGVLPSLKQREGRSAKGGASP